MMQKGPLLWWFFDLEAIFDVDAGKHGTYTNNVTHIHKSRFIEINVFR